MIHLYLTFAVGCFWLLTLSHNAQHAALITHHSSLSPHHFPQFIVRVSAESVARTDRLLLGEIVTIEMSKDAADSAMEERLRSIALGYAPAVGVVREIQKDRILLAISAAGFPPGSVQVEGASIALVRRAAQTASPELVREAVERAALAELRAGGAAARLARLDLPATIEAPAGELEARASIGSARNLFVPFIVSVELWQSGRVVHRFSTTAQVEAFAPVLTAARDLGANIRLRKEDLTVEARRLERSLSLYVRDPAIVRGSSLRQPIARGAAITTDLLAAEIVIKPGDAVRISVESGPLKISAMGEAAAAGRVGDRIQVKNKQSGALLQAVIVDEGVVSVRF